MDESFEQYIGYIIFFVMFVLPRILRALKGKKQKAPQETAPSPNSIEELFGGETVALKEEAVELEDGVPAGYEQEIDALKAETEKLLEGATSMVQTCVARGGAVQKLAGIVQNNAVLPLKKLDSRLDLWGSRPEEANENAIYRAGLSLEKMAELLDLLDRMVSQRLQPSTSDLLTQLDVAVRESLLPFIIHAQRMELVYPTQHALTLVGDDENRPGELLGEANLAAVVVDEPIASLPRSWALMISNLYLDVFFSTRGMANRLVTDLGILPRPLSSLDYHRGKDSRVLAESIAGTFLPRIFADVAAALYLGPGLVFGLRSSVGSGLAEERALQLGLEDAGRVPMYVRVFAACRAVSHVGYGKEAQDHWRQFNQRLGDPSVITVADREKKRVDLPINLVLNAVARVVDFIVKEPLPALGGYPLSAVQSLVCDRECAARIQEISAALGQGVPTNAPARIIVGAALDAVEKSPTTEQRISTAALRSLSGEGVASIEVEKVSSGEPRTLQEAVQSPEFIMRAIVTGAAVAPRPR